MLDFEVDYNTGVHTRSPYTDGIREWVNKNWKKGWDYFDEGEEPDLDLNKKCVLSSIELNETVFNDVKWKYKYALNSIKYDF